MNPTMTSLKGTAFMLLVFSLISLNSFSVNAQCGFSLGDTLVRITAAAGQSVDVPVSITNTSNAAYTVWLSASSNFPFSFNVKDSIINNLAPGTTDTFHITFSPSLNASGVGRGVLSVTNAKTFCNKQIDLIGIVTPNLCLETVHDFSYKDPVLVGSSAEHEFHLTNQSNFDIIATNVLIPDTANPGGFKITSQFPLTIPAHTSDKVLTYEFAPRSDYSGTFFNTEFVYLSLSGDSVQCPQITLFLIGNVAKPGGGSGIDTNIRPIFPSQARTLALTGTGKKISEKFTFTNNLNIVCTVNNIYMKYGTYFRIAATNPSPTPFTLGPDQTMTVTIEDSSLNQTIHTDSLMMDVTHNLQTVAFQVQSVEQTSGSVSNILPEDVSITISPNPAADVVTVALIGVLSGDLQVFDMLGKQITSTKADGLWKWNTVSMPGGTYIVRIAGESLKKEHFVSSQKVIVRK
jgi:hypothetical protein